MEGADSPAVAGVRSRLAQSIRDGAGLPPGAVAGVRPGRTPGPDSPGALVPSPAIEVRSRADAAAVAHRGAGTADDPWVIEGLEVVGEEEDFAFLWSDPGADYRIRLENCRLRGGDEARIYVRTATRFELSRAEILGDGDDGDGIRLAGGGILLERVSFDALGGDGVRTVGADPLTVEITDCSFTDRLGPWDDAASGVQAVGANPAHAIRVAWCDFAAASLGSGVTTWRQADWTIANCRFAGRIGIRSGDDEVAGVRVTACVFETAENAIRVEAWTSWEVAACVFRDNEAGYRLVRFEECGPGRVHHCRFRKTTGEGAGNECLESFDSRDVEFDHNWVEVASEDAFEHVRPRGNCTVHHSVGDRVAGQIVDYFGHHPENGGEVHHIYGDCADVGVLITDVDRIIVRDIHTDNRAGLWGNVVLEQRHSDPGEHPAGCRVRWPLPAASLSAGGRPFAVRGEVGPDNSAAWWEGGEIRRFPF